MSGLKPVQDKSSLRWWGAAIGVAIAVADTILPGWVGIDLTSGGHDLTLVVGAWFGISFALVGFLFGQAIDDRRRSHAAAELIRAQMKELDASRLQLVQSEKLAVLGTLAAAIAHEVRNPLAVIRSAAQSIAEAMPPGSEQARRSCKFVLEETDRLANLVNSLIAFARPVRVVAHPVAASELVDRALVLAHTEIEAKHLSVERRMADPWMASADPELIAQVVGGLLTNAAQALPAGGKVRIEGRSTDSTVEMAVEDSGPGVSPEIRDRIFEPFFTTRASGVGLGLAIARQIAEAHGGSLELAESSMGGARFNLTLPRATL